MRLWSLAILLVFSGTFLLAQNISPKFVFGLGIEAQKSKLEVFVRDWQRLGFADLENIELDEKVGARLHLDVHYQVGLRSSFRFSPGIFFQQNEIKFVLRDQNDVGIKILPLGLAIPLYYQYAPQGLLKGPRFFIGGEVQSLLGDYSSEYISLYEYNVLGKIGVAVPISSRFIRWVPSLTFGMGLENIKKFEEGGMLNTAIDAIQMNTLQFGVSIFFLKDKNENVD